MGPRLPRLRSSASDLGVTQPAGSDLRALAWETILTSMLVLVITAVATDTRAVGEAAALAIGGTVALGALVGGGSLHGLQGGGGPRGNLDLSRRPVLGAVLGALAYRHLRGS